MGQPPNTNRYNSTLSPLITYDANGNLLTDTFHTYTWDAAGHPVTFDSSACGTNGTCATYDALGRIAEKNVAGTYTEFLYSPVGKLGLMNGQTLVNLYIPLPGGETYNIAPGYTRFWHKDWLGTVRLSSIRGNRSVDYDRAFAPFGEGYKNFGSTANYNFTGDTQDTISGTFDTMFRELNPSQGRWLSPDPGGIAVVSPANPQTWNRFAYVSGYPLISVDQLGLEDCFVRLGGESCPNGIGSGPLLYNGGTLQGGDDGSSALRLLNSPVANPNFPGWNGTIFAGGQVWIWQQKHDPNASCQGGGMICTGIVGGYVAIGSSGQQSMFAPADNDSWLWAATKSFVRDFSFFGPKNDPRPSCFGNFVKESVGNFVGVPGIDTVAAGAATHYGISLSVAQAVPSSRALRGGLSAKQWLAADEAARVSNAGKFSLWFNADIAMAQAFFQKELPAALAGECK